MVAVTTTLAGCTDGGGGSRTTTRSSTTAARSTRTAGEPETTPTERETTTPEFDRPATGERVPELADVDHAMRSFLAENDVQGAALAVAKDGEVALERGYGWRDADRKNPTQPDSPFRVASVTKCFTSAAIRSLVRDGRLAMDDRPFRELDIEAPEGASRTEGLDDITVAHLLRHEGGWDTQVAGDPMFRYFDIANALELDRAPSTREIARYMLAQPLQFDPGSRQAYSNFGYAVLGLLVERVTGTPYPEFVRTALYDEDVSAALYEGRTRPAARPDREVTYDSESECPNALTLDESETVPCADGGIVVETLGGAGELVANTRVLLSFADAYTLLGEPRGDGEWNLRYFGSLPGSFSMVRQRRDGVDVAALLNSRGRTPTAYAELSDVLDTALDDVDGWP